MTLFRLESRGPGELDGSAHIYVAKLSQFSSPDLLESCKTVLSEHERTRLRKIRSKRDADSYIISHALLREALSCFHDTAADAWQFSRKPNGKPFISASQNAAGLQFSLSHCTSAAAVLVTRNQQCGIDIEHTGRKVDYFRVAKKMFSPAENDFLSQSSDPRHDFFRLWTLREACAKATGKGIANSAAEFELQIHGNNFQYRDLVTQRIDAQWQLAITPRLNDHITAVAIRNHGQPLVLHTSVVTR